ncbi:MAG TPA: hypothetical protein PLX92_06855, partial [Anaerolineaceae bacterium]|nr:hypothetical protein [Anaerolineaceae bacterium]
VELRGVSVLIGNAASRLELEVTPPDSQTPLEFSAEIGPQQAYRTLGISFDMTLQVQSLHIQLYDLDQSEPGHVHLWEMSLQ